MLKTVRWGLLVVMAVAACGCGSGRARSRTQSEGIGASAPTKRQPARVLSYCAVSAGEGYLLVGNRPTDNVEVDIDVALDGAETETSEPDAETPGLSLQAASTLQGGDLHRALIQIRSFGLVRAA